MAYKLSFPTTMRVAPTLSSITGVAIQSNVASFNAYRQKAKSAEVFATSTGAGAFYFIDGKFTASAEL
jgi:hypothetical protein